MDLQFLNRLDTDQISLNGGMSIDAEDLLSSQLPTNDESVGALKDFFKKTKEKVQNVTQNIKQDVHKVSTGVKQAVKKTGAAVKTAVHVINRVNPATAALRLGLLASMKLNLFGVAGQLRYAYLSDEHAQSKGLNMKRFARYKKVREKLEKIFFNAGGKPQNLQEAILSGKGNQDKAVPVAIQLTGLSFSNSSSVRDIIGADMYHDEITGDTLNGLGEPVTAATIAAASGILATIAGVLKNIGSLFQKGEPGPDADLDALEQQSGATTEPTEGSSTEEPTAPSTERESTDTSTTNTDSTGTGTGSTSTDNTDTGGGDGSGSQSGSGDAPPGPSTSSFFDNAKAWIVKNKTPLIATGIAVGVGVTAYVLFRNYGGKKKAKGERAETTQGVPRGARSHHQPKGKSGGGKNDKILRDLRLSRLK